MRLLVQVQPGPPSRFGDVKPNHVVGTYKRPKIKVMRGVGGTKVSEQNRHVWEISLVERHAAVNRTTEVQSLYLPPSEQSHRLSKDCRVLLIDQQSI